MIVIIIVIEEAMTSDWWEWREGSYYDVTQPVTTHILPRYRYSDI